MLFAQEEVVHLQKKNGSEKKQIKEERQDLNEKKIFSKLFLFAFKKLKQIKNDYKQDNRDKT